MTIMITTMTTGISSRINLEKFKEMPNYKIADVIWNICPKQSQTKALLRKYEFPEPVADVTVPAFPESAVAEHMQLLQYINDTLAGGYQGLMLHAAALVYNRKAYLFVALPGTGKTTHLRLWQQVMGEKVFVLNGDKPFLRVKDGQILVYGGPWQGKEGLGCNAVCPLGGVYLLRRGRENRVCKISAPEKLKGLLDAILLCEDHRTMLGAMEVLNTLCRTAPVSALYCNMTPDAVDAVRRHIEEEGCEN